MTITITPINMVTRPLICADCQHYSHYGLCKYGGPQEIDMVTGVKSYRIAAATREDENLCGLSARWFEPRRTWWRLFRSFLPDGGVS